MTSAHVKGVIDMTFLDIREEADFKTGFDLRYTSKIVVVISSPTPITTNAVINNKTKENSVTLEKEGSPSRSKSPSKKKSSMISSTEEIKAIRIANNEIPSIDIIFSTITASLDTSKILWVDLSFNFLHKISSELSKILPNLTTIYLHANKISKLAEIKKLGGLINLKSVALYGNPVEDHKHYRNFVLYTCPKLSQFDMSPVTKSEVKLVSYYIFYNYSFFLLYLFSYYYILDGSLGTNF